MQPGLASRIPASPTCTGTTVSLLSHFFSRSVQCTVFSLKEFTVGILDLATYLVASRTYRRLRSIQSMKARGWWRPRQWWLRQKSSPPAWSSSKSHWLRLRMPSDHKIWTARRRGGTAFRRRAVVRARCRIPVDTGCHRRNTERHRPCSRGRYRRRKGWPEGSLFDCLEGRASSCRTDRAVRELVPAVDCWPG